MANTLPPNCVTSNAGIDASGLTTVAHIDGGSMKLSNTMVHDRFRRTVPTNVMDAPRLVGGTDGVGFTISADTLEVDSCNQSSASEDLVRLTFTVPQGLTAGAVMMMNEDLTTFTQFYYRVVRVVSAFDVVINMTHTNAVNTKNPTVSTVVGAFADDCVSIRKPHDNLRHDAIHKVNAMRTIRVASSIRAGQWNEYSGQFSIPVTGANDYNAMAVSGTFDDEVTAKAGGQGLKNEFAFREERNRVITGDN